MPGASLHQTLARLVRERGREVFVDVELLGDAVRLGALQTLITTLDEGASVESAVEDAGRRLARDRGSLDVAAAQWAVAVLGYAMGLVPESMVADLRPNTGH